MTGPTWAEIERVAKDYIERGRTDVYGRAIYGDWDYIKANKPLAYDEALRIAKWALSVPAAAVVGEPEPIGYCSEYGLDKLASQAHHYCLSVSKAQENEFQFPIYASRISQQDAELERLRLEVEWRPIETAPKDGTEILAYGYARCDGSRYANGQHIAWWDAELGWTGRDSDDRVTLHLSHWRPLPPRPELGGE